MKSFILVSLGCSKNLVDAEGMLGLLTSNGYELVNDEKNAEIVIINTCSFIKSAKEEAIESILEHSKLKSEGKCKALIVTGCMAQRYKDKILKQMPEVDAVIGTGSYHKIVDIINELNNKKGIIELSDKNKSPLEPLNRMVSTPFYTAYLKIAEGCSNNCTYCVIPKIRGKYRSRKIESIVSEAKSLVENGAMELIVIAQDITSYGKDLYKKPSLVALLNELCKIEDLKWIRLHYAYPELIDDELIEVMAKNDKIVKYLDLPIQHCEDEILAEMGRKSTKKQLLLLIKKLREKISDITLRTSIIVGFPNETEENFESLCRFIKKVKFDRMGVFSYSREEGTKAAKFKNQVPEKIKNYRFDKLMKIQMQISKQINKSFVNKTLEVLVEGYDTLNEIHFGRSQRDSIDIDGKVYFKSNKRYESGDFVNVVITSYDEYNLFGQEAQIR